MTVRPRPPASAAPCARVCRGRRGEPRRGVGGQGVGRHPGVGSGRLTQDDLASLIAPTAENEKRKRHDEVQYKGKWGEPLVGYWTLGACDGSNGCVHKVRAKLRAPTRPELRRVHGRGRVGAVGAEASIGAAPKRA
jgi:hypothetical protein